MRLNAMTMLLLTAFAGASVPLIRSSVTAYAGQSCTLGCCAELNQACGSDASICDLPGEGEAPCEPEPCGNYCWEQQDQ